MRATNLFRITAVLFVLFAAGHTFGFLSFKAPTQEGMAVLESMNTVHFEVHRRIFSYGGWYRGFGLSATAAMLFEAFLAWYLGVMAERGAREVKVLGWGFFAWQMPAIALAWIYFGLLPIALSIVVAALIGLATWLADTNLP